MQQLEPINRKKPGNANHISPTRLRERLLDTQFELMESRRFSVLIVIAGFDKVGKANAINRLNKWLDIHKVKTIAEPQSHLDPDDLHVAFEPFWQSLPANGEIGIYYGGWYSEAIESIVSEHKSPHRKKYVLKQIRRFEQTLTDAGILILKYWLQLPYKNLQARRKQHYKNPQRYWHIDHSLPMAKKAYQRAREKAQKLLLKTHTSAANWRLIEETDSRTRRLILVEDIQKTIQKRLDQTGSSDPDETAEHTLIDKPYRFARVQQRLPQLELDQPMDKDRYKAQLQLLQGKLHRQCRRDILGNQAVVVVFEGNDAAGKGGAIRRVAASLEAAQCQVIPIAAPTDIEKQHPYLWRFWQNLPSQGQVHLFDRSWYGRVLVERVEGLCTEHEWQRAYDEINYFEKQMVKSGIIVIKFWLAIDQETQLQRFREREMAGYKRYKLTADDWRNRAHWDEYAEAAEAIFYHTDTERAPWYIIEANNKQFARIKILKILCERIAAATR